ncbi:MAG: cysteine desulfurase [Candidatus Wallbacteria bacterium HGW-Wallbacteria-1]|jgi:cysteine desulfurase family protein|uniref:cysteine desulfurase n=1 Tax=Candidatus Wallbacteria bacterium HGW-Wallbacteria-1 TaxID=2013854 RepID=A0A2N1PLD5_9BACT|nr:MAG: cysteine desulfurase [Candidatus Wallbacteria bacterium HGW-Wallbacteria-1]
MNSSLIYLDNAATSFPKAPGVAVATADFLDNIGSSPGRSSHAGAMKATSLIFDTRELLAELLDVSDSENIVLTSGTTLSLNMAIFGFLKGKCLFSDARRSGSKSIGRVLTSGMEHNSVMRPLRYLQNAGEIDLDIFRCDESGYPDLEHYRDLLSARPELVVHTACSNITGTIFPLAEMAEMAHEAGAVICIDGAQMVGSIPLSVREVGIDMLAFSGHKGLLGPTGTGGLYVSEKVRLTPIIFGGTGSRSDQEIQPEFNPDSLESGTPNTAGIAGLHKALEFILETGADQIHQKCLHFRDLLFDKLSEIEGIILKGPGSGSNAGSVVSFTHATIPIDVITSRLDRESVAVRMGLHCAPAAHRTIGTFPYGTIRMSPGPFTSEDEICGAVKIVRGICNE